MAHRSIFAVEDPVVATRVELKLAVAPNQVFKIPGLVPRREVLLWVGVGWNCGVCISWRMGIWAREMKKKAQVNKVTTTSRPQASDWNNWWTDLNRRRRYLEVSWADMLVGGCFGG